MAPKRKTDESSCTTLAIPTLFAVKQKVGKGSGNHCRGNQWTAKEDKELTEQGVKKRIWGKMQNAIKKAPPVVQDKWNQILALRGKRQGGIFHHKREFLMKWVQDPTWAVLTDIALNRYCLYKALPV